MKVGLVLGAGGIQGGAWLTGGLDAIAQETGWDPASADRIVGTSAGSMIGALLAAGVPPWFMVAHSAGETFEGVTDATGESHAEADRSGGAVFRLHRGLPSRPRLVEPRAAHARAPAPPPAGGDRRRLAAARLDLDRAAEGAGPPRRPGRLRPASGPLGRRLRLRDRAPVAFGRDGSPPAELADAVAASCAIPGFYRPVEIGGRCYVDGGMCSTSNLDLVRGERLDLVICLNPTSSLHPTRAWNPLERGARLLRGQTGRRLGSEARTLRERGTDVVLIQPTAADLEAMGPNLMSSKDRNPVIELARATVAEQLRESRHADLLAELPAGRAREGPPSRRPALGLAAAARAPGRLSGAQPSSIEALTRRSSSTIQRIAPSERTCRSARLRGVAVLDLAVEPARPRRPRHSSSIGAQ